jgi:predicted CoA-binding protein
MFLAIHQTLLAYSFEVAGVNPSMEESLNGPERFEKAFKDVPKEVTKVFENTDELYAELDALRREVAAASQEVAL